MIITILILSGMVTLIIYFRRHGNGKLLQQYTGLESLPVIEFDDKDEYGDELRKVIDEVYKAYIMKYDFGDEVQKLHMIMDVFTFKTDIQFVYDRDEYYRIRYTQICKDKVIEIANAYIGGQRVFNMSERSVSAVIGQCKASIYYYDKYKINK